MASVLNFILLFSAGLWALALCASRQFYVVEAEISWTEAQNMCRENYTDLATIENEEEMNTIKDLLKGKNDNFWTSTDRKEKHVWIGLKQNKTSLGTFNVSSWSWSDGAPYNYSYWQNKEPNFGNENSFCVELYKEMNTWNDAGCNHLNSFICYKRQTPLIVITEKKTWREALKFCRQNHVDLVSVYSHEMQNWVEVVTKNVSTDLWLGLRHTCALGFWYWVKGEMICYQNWAPGNGTGVEDCGDVERTGALLSHSKKWVSLPQTHKLPFICITF